jgi:predicted helicase
LVTGQRTVALVDQILRDWRGDGVLDFTALAVCSDDTTVDAHVNLEDLTAGVTTDPGDVADWLRSGPGRRVIVSTYRSAAVVAQAVRQLHMIADVSVCNESNHLAGSRRLRLPDVVDASTHGRVDVCSGLDPSHLLGLRSVLALHRQ